MPPPTKRKLTKHSINTLTKLVGLISSQRKTGRLNVTLYTALNRLQLALIGGCNKYLTTIPVINPFCHNCVSMWTPVDWFYTLFAFTVDSLYSCWKAFNMEVGNCSFSDRRASLRLRTYIGWWVLACCYNLQFIPKVWTLSRPVKFFDIRLRKQFLFNLFFCMDLTLYKGIEVRKEKGRLILLQILI